MSGDVFETLDKAGGSVSTPDKFDHACNILSFFMNFSGFFRFLFSLTETR